MTITYLFYDLETTGLNKSFDQILQFAAVRTDTDFNELERHEFFVKLNPDVIPSPKAMITHNISFDQINSGIPEFEAISKIHKLMNEPETINLGYNSIEFDEEILRFSFYRNLFDPYTHQYNNFCKRMDILPITVMYFLYNEEAAIKWSKREDPNEENKVSLKLENINRENQFVEGESHDAMTDVLVTVELTRKLMKHPKMWNYMCSYFDKKKEEERIKKLDEAVITSVFSGFKNSYQNYVRFLGESNHYTNQTIWLRLDKPNLMETTKNSIPETTLVFRKKKSDNLFLLPCSYYKNKDAENLKIIEENKKWILENPQLMEEITSYHKDFKYDEVPNADIDSKLYVDDFLSKTERNFCSKFCKANIQQKVEMLDNFLNQKLKQQAIRIIARNYPEFLPEEYEIAIDPDISIVDFKGKEKLTASAAFEEISKLRETNLNEKEITSLDNLEKYLKGLSLKYGHLID